MPSLAELTDQYPQQDTSLPVAQPYRGANLGPLSAVGVPTGVVGGDPTVAAPAPAIQPDPNSVGTTDYADKNGFGVGQGVMGGFGRLSGQDIVDKLLGLGGQERYQLWPEKVVRDAISAPHDIVQANPYPEGSEENSWFEDQRQNSMVPAALNMSALAGTGGLAGVPMDSVSRLGTNLRILGKKIGTQVGEDAVVPESEGVRSAYIKSGDKIFEASNHPLAIENAAKAKGIDLNDNEAFEKFLDNDISSQGFVTSKGRLIDRNEAYDIAKDNKQIQNSYETKSLDASDPSNPIKFSNSNVVLGSGPFLRPALKVGDKIYKAPIKDPANPLGFGAEHSDALPASMADDFYKKAMSGEDINHYNFGFVNHKGQFLDREKALDYGIQQGLVDPQNGKYGVLTSTMLADSSKPGTAIESLAKSGPDYIYHSTLPSNEAAIAKKGLINKNTGIYFAPNEKMMNAWHNEGNIIYRVDKTKIKDLKSEIEGQSADTNSLLTYSKIPSSNLEISKDGGKTFTTLADSSKPGTAIEAMAKTNQPFYSALEHNVNAIPQAKMTGDQWLGTLANKPGVKPEEMDWTGVKDFLKEKGNQPVTKAELQEHLQNNKVELKEVDKGVDLTAKQVFENNSNKKWDDLTPADQKAYSNIVERQGNLVSYPTKYHSYQLAGGENYREKLLTLPPTQNTLNQFKVINEHGHVESTWTDKAKADAWAAKNNYTVREDKPVILNGGYKSSHWDEPNILAHVRMNDRMIDGKKSLHLEEIQSDAHQEGRSKGYVSDQKTAMTKVQDLIKEASTLSTNDARYKEIYKELPEWQAKANVKAIPDMPFKKSWHELALKRMIREAAEKGYDRLSWTPGEAQAARYDLIKSIDRIEYNPTTGYLRASKGREAPIRQNVNSEKLGDVIGKEAAKKILENPTEKMEVAKGNLHVLEGQDLKIGGEGMKGFYDQIIPKAANKLVEKYGVKVQTGKTKEGQAVHYLDLPEKLKNDVMGKGFPLFSSSHMFIPVSHNPFEEKKK